MGDSPAATGISVLGNTFSWITDRMSDMVAVITGAPIYLLALGVWIVGAVIGLGYRLIRGN